MRLTAGLDSGPVCLLEREPIHSDDTYGTLAPRLQRLGGDLLVRALDERPPFSEQDETGVTYAEKIGAEDRTLDPLAADATTLERTVRALTPHIGARLALPTERAPAGGPDGGSAPAVQPAFLGIAAARATAATAAPAPGVLAEHDGHLLLGAAGGTALELTTVQPPGGRPMDAADYLRGHGLPAR
jgi:methionyl-tRNA formyltransferase